MRSASTDPIKTVFCTRRIVLCKSLYSFIFFFLFFFYAIFTPLVFFHLTDGILLTYALMNFFQPKCETSSQSRHVVSSIRIYYVDKSFSFLIDAPRTTYYLYGIEKTIMADRESYLGVKKPKTISQSTKRYRGRSEMSVSIVS